MRWWKNAALFVIHLFIEMCSKQLASASYDSYDEGLFSGIPVRFISFCTFLINLIVPLNKTTTNIYVINTLVSMNTENKWDSLEAQTSFAQPYRFSGNKIKYIHVVSFSY